jgi:low temperature requirement protein LtrA
MNFTWFASAYDTDDISYRLTTMVQIAGALVFAAGVPRALEERDFAVTTLGYVIMRLAMVTQWLRAAHDDPERRRGCLRFAAGVTVVQAGWVARLALPQGWDMAAFAVLALADLAVPVWAELGARTTWHPGHIAERYGLFTIIVLGESVLAATLAVQSALDEQTVLAALAATVMGGTLTVFSMWWLYFSKPPVTFLTSLRAGFRWGYGHYVIFGSAAAVGAGLAVAVDSITGAAHVGPTAAAATFTVPVAVFLVAVWALQWRPHHVAGWHNAVAPAFASAVLLATFTPQPVLATGALLAGSVLAGVLTTRAARRHSRDERRPHRAGASPHPVRW